MRKIVAPLSAGLLLAAVTATAQDKMKDPPPAGHEGMAKAGAAISDAAVIAKATSAAPPDIGRHAVVMGVGADGKMNELRCAPTPMGGERGGRYPVRAAALAPVARTRFGWAP